MVIRLIPLRCFTSYCSNFTSDQSFRVSLETPITVACSARSSNCGRMCSRLLIIEAGDIITSPLTPGTQLGAEERYAKISGILAVDESKPLVSSASSACPVGEESD